MTETVSIALTTTTAVEHHGKGKVSSSFTTTIPTDFEFAEAQEMIRQIVDGLAQAVTDDYTRETKNTATFQLTSVTRDEQGDRYSFSVEYSAVLFEYVLRYANEECGVDLV
ncbi:MAG: hypothetical protein NC299_17055 [Lachnospiraceae bacterium]|nr:hypothetical protein [Ruminococcus sp.]MCM1277040.1 hypothetical protein [Lachnospiraceae bacterium]